MAVLMKKKSKYFQLAYGAIVCAFIFTGCSDYNRREEKILMENEKEESELKEKSGLEEEPELKEKSGLEEELENERTEGARCEGE